MIICSCNALREAQVRDAVAAGVRCEKAAYRHLGCRPKCGHCRHHLRDFVQMELTRISA